MTNFDNRQPWMQDMHPLVAAPAQLWADSRGSIVGSQPYNNGPNVAGYYVGDTRVISDIVPSIDGETPTILSWSNSSPGVSVTKSIARNITGKTVDPQLRLTSRTVISPQELGLTYTFTSALDHAAQFVFDLALNFDMSSMQEIKGGHPSSAAAAGEIAVNVDSTDNGNLFSASYKSIAAHVYQESVFAHHSRVEGTHAHATWNVEVPPRGTSIIVVRVSSEYADGVTIAAEDSAQWKNVKVTAQDSRVRRWANASLRDLVGLRMTTREMPHDEFIAAGAPWFFTLFGRDSLWTARFLLPLGTKTAMGTLRTLAHFQATQTDVKTNADPGKIMHELRAEPLIQTGVFADGTELPPLYYGTIDATELWIILLAEAYRWGADREEVRALLPNLEAALTWMRDYADSDGDGFLEYVDKTGRGLANQGWKDSGDSVRWNDGRLAEGPIALCEVQAYAYQAALAGADLLDEFGCEGADEWRNWAAKLKQRFNEQFWVTGVDANGKERRYVAIALDKDKKPVDSLTSNIGQLLGTGILEEQGVRDIVECIVADDMFSGYGVRTMSTLAGGYSAESYHCGSVWAHDSAIIMSGLRAEGYTQEALRIAEGLVNAAEHFEYQIPELYSGDDSNVAPSAYPAACHPQAWAAASAIPVISLLLGLNPERGDDGEVRVVSNPIDCALSQGLEIHT